MAVEGCENCRKKREQRERQTEQPQPAQHQQRSITTPTGQAPGYRIRKVQSLPAGAQIWDYVWDESQRTICVWDGTQWICLTGAGADCMYDHLVSPCWADVVAAGKGTEGQTFTSQSNCDFRIWSTLAGAAGAANFSNSTVYLCVGDHTVTAQLNIFHDSDEVLTFIGAGMERTRIIGTQASGRMLNFSGPASPDAYGIVVKNLSIMADNPIELVRLAAGALSFEDVIFDLDRGGGGVGLNVPSGVSLYGLNVKFFGGTNNVGTGITFASGSVDDDNGAHRLIKCFFDTSIGIQCSGSDDVWVDNSDFLCESRDVLFTTSSLMERVSFNNSRFTKGVRIESVAGIVHKGLSFSTCKWRLGANEVGIDYDHTTTSATALGLSVQDCEFHATTASSIGIRGETDGPIQSIIKGNKFFGFTANNEMVGLLATLASGNQIGHNTTDSGATLPDTHTLTLAPVDAGYLTLSFSGSLTQERVFTPRYNLYATDAGANSTYTVDSWLEGAAIASAATLTLGTDGDVFHVTGATGITAIATPTRQTIVALVFDSAPTLTHGANLILQGAVNFVAAAGDVLIFLWEGGTVWREINRHTAAAAAGGAGHAIHEEVAAALTTRADLHFMGKGLLAQDNAPSTRTEVIAGAYYDAIVDSDDTNAAGKGNVYSDLQAAITAGHQSIFYRIGTDTADITIGAGDAVTRIIGDSTTTANVRVNVKCDKGSVLFDNLLFYDDLNVKGKYLWLNAAQCIAFACAYTGALDEPQAQINNGAGITSTATTIAYDNGINGNLPTSGLGQMDDEIFFWTGGGGAASGTLTGCTNRANFTYDRLNTAHVDNTFLYSLYSGHLVISANDCQAIACRFIACTSPHSMAVFVRAGGNRARIISCVFLANTTFHAIGMTGENVTLSPTRGPFEVQIVGNSINSPATKDFTVGTLPMEAQNWAVVNGAADHCITGSMNGNSIVGFHGGFFKHRSRQWSITGNTLDGGDFTAGNVGTPNTLAYQINLVGGITAADTTIPYDNASGIGTLADCGLIKIENEWIFYSSKTGTQFQNCIRGVQASTAATHANDIAITNYSQRAIYTCGGPSNQPFEVSGNVMTGITLVLDTKRGTQNSGPVLFATNLVTKFTLINGYLGNLYMTNLFSGGTLDLGTAHTGQTLLGGLPPATISNLPADFYMFCPSNVSVAGVATPMFFAAGAKVGYGRVAGDEVVDAIPVTNRTGAASVAGDVVILDAANNNSYILAGLVRSDDVLGVTVQGGVANLSDALIANDGVFLVNVDTGAVVVGDMLVTSIITAGRAGALAAPAIGTVFAKAMTAKAAGANGTVKAVRFTA